MGFRTLATSITLTTGKKGKGDTIDPIYHEPGTKVWLEEDEARSLFLRFGGELGPIVDAIPEGEPAARQPEPDPQTSNGTDVVPQAAAPVAPLVTQNDANDDAAKAKGRK